MSRVEAKKDGRGQWGVYVDGVLVSTHNDHVAARRAAQGHLR